MLATDDMALSYSQQLAILLSNINHALIHLDGGSKSGWLGRGRGDVRNGSS